MGLWTDRMMRKRMRALGIKPNASNMARADRACNMNNATRRLVKEESKAKGRGGVRRLDGSEWKPPKTPEIED